MLFGLIDITHIRTCIANSSRRMRREYRDGLQKCGGELEEALREYDALGGSDAKDGVLAKYGELVSTTQYIEGCVYITNYCYLLLKGQMKRLKRWARGELATRFGKDVLDGELGELAIFLASGRNAPSRARGFLGRLRRMVIPDGTTRLETGKFMLMPRLRVVVCPDSLVEIKEFAFFGCKRLRYVSIGRGIERLGEGAFGACHKRLHIKFRGHVQEWQAKGFKSVASPFMRGQVSCTDGTVKL